MSSNKSFDCETFLSREIPLQLSVYFDPYNTLDDPSPIILVYLLHFPKLWKSLYFNVLGSFLAFNGFGLHVTEFWVIF